MKRYYSQHRNHSLNFISVQLNNVYGFRFHSKMNHRRNDDEDEKQRKKPKFETDTKWLPHQTKLTDIFDDCFEIISMNLSFNDLLNIADTKKQLRQGVDMTFLQRRRSIALHAFRFNYNAMRKGDTIYNMFNGRFDLTRRLSRDEPPKSEWYDEAAKLFDLLTFSQLISLNDINIYVSNWYSINNIINWNEKFIILLYFTDP